MRNYYFVAASLPDLQLHKELEITFSDLMRLFAMNLHSEDFAQIAIFRSYFDLDNIFHLLREEELDPRGNLFRWELEEALLHTQGLPEYIIEFLLRYPKDEQRLKNSHIAYELFYRRVIAQTSGFLHTYLLFERRMRLVLAAYRAKKEGRAWENELIDEERSELFTAQLIAQKEGTTLDFPLEYRSLYEKIQSAEAPQEQNLAIAEYRIRKIDEMCDFPLFSFDYLVAYMAKFIILEELQNVMSR